MAGQLLAPGHWEADSGGLCCTTLGIPWFLWGKEKGRKKRKARHWVDGEEVVEHRA